MYKQLCAQCDIMCKQFIKCCNQYSGKGFTSTLHTGSHNRVLKSENIPGGMSQDPQNNIHVCCMLQMSNLLSPSTL